MCARRGNLKVIGMASRNDEREHEPRCGTRYPIPCKGQLARFNCCPDFFEQPVQKIGRFSSKTYRFYKDTNYFA